MSAPTPTPSRRIGLLGGSFDPPHVAHQMVCLHALATGGLDEVWLVPCLRHAFAKDLAPFADRLRMCELAAGPFGAQARASDVERTLGGTSRTLVTLRHLRDAHPDVRWTLVLGSDLLGEVAQWYGWDEIRGLADLHVVPRGTAPEEPAIVLPDVSSTVVRQRLRAGLPVDGLVPTTVLAHIRSRGLYGARDGRCP